MEERKEQVEANSNTGAAEGPSGPDLDAAAGEQQAAQATADNFPKPICCFCKHDPLIIATRDFRIPPATYLIAFCFNCKMMLNTQLVSMEAPRIMGAPAMPPQCPTIVRP